MFDGSSPAQCSPCPTMKMHGPAASSQLYTDTGRSDTLDQRAWRKVASGHRAAKGPTAWSRSIPETGSRTVTARCWDGAMVPDIASESGISSETHLLGALTQVLDRLVDAGPAPLADGNSVVALFGQLQRLEAVTSSAAAAFDDCGAWAVDGARTAAAWLAWRCRLPKGAVRRTIGLGRAVRDLPAAGEAWTLGHIGACHVATLAALRRHDTADRLSRDEPLLVGHACTLSHPEFRQAAAYWEQLADPDGCDEAEERRRARRGVNLSASFDGMWLGSITLDPVAGTIVADELGRLQHHLFEADWAEARERLGADHLQHGDLRRSAAQRRADALVEMARRSRTAPDDGRRPTPLFSVLVGYETLHGRICQLANGQVVAPAAMVPWLTEADIERAVFGPGNRVEVSAASRFFTGGTRRAIELRDRACTHPTCDEPIDRCQVDHIVPWTQGGATIQENGRLLCGFHNRLRNQRPPPAA